MASLLFRLCGRSPHNSPLVVGPRALAEALNKKGGRGRPSSLRIEFAPFSPRPAFQLLGTLQVNPIDSADSSFGFQVFTTQSVGSLLRENATHLSSGSMYIMLSG